MVKKQEVTMVLKVDLECTRCCKKVKKVLCKISQIRDQVYDKKQNTVTIKVVCVCPEQIKKAIIKEGGIAIKCVDIVKLELTVSPPTEPAVQKDPEPEMTEEPSGVKATADDNVEGQVKENPESPPHFVDEGCHKRPIHTHCVECYRESRHGPCLHGSGSHPPPWMFYNEPNCDGNGGRRPVGYECHVVQWETSPQENYGPCSIM